MRNNDNWWKSQSSRTIYGVESVPSEPNNAGVRLRMKKLLLEKEGFDWNISRLFNGISRSNEHQMEGRDIFPNKVTG